MDENSTSLTEAQKHQLIDETEQALAGARRGARWNQEQLAEFLAERYEKVGVDAPLAIARVRARTALEFAESAKNFRERQLDFKPRRVS